MAKRTFDAGADMAGIPDSPVLTRVPPDDFPPNPVLELHVGGVLVADMPLEAQGRILYQQTDEGIAEFNEGKSESAARVVHDEFSKALKHRKDAVRDLGMELSEAPNPMKEAMQEHIPPGFRGRFLSPAVVDRRGMRGWAPVLDEQGNQVKVRNQFLAMMPESVAIARNKAVREHSNKLLGQVRKQYLEEGGATAVAD